MLVETALVAGSRLCTICAVRYLGRALCRAVGGAALSAFGNVVGGRVPRWWPGLSGAVADIDYGDGVDSVSALAHEIAHLMAGGWSAPRVAAVLKGANAEGLPGCRRAAGASSRRTYGRIAWRRASALTRRRLPAWTATARYSDRRRPAGLDASALLPLERLAIRRCVYVPSQETVS